MPDQNSLHQVMSEIQERREAEARVRKERVRNLKSHFLINPGSVNDTELLEIVFDAPSELGNPDFHQEQDLDPYVEALSFSTKPLDSIGAENLKTAWSEFFKETFSRMGDLEEEDVQHGLIADWYFRREMWAHSVAVYEHVYWKIHQMELVNCRECHATWVLQLWKACIKFGLKRRALDLTPRIKEYEGEGEITPEDFFDVLTEEVELRFQNQRDLFDRERGLAKDRLSMEYGPLFDSLNKITRDYVFEAELWSHATLRELEPTAGPRRWILAIESEFHHKVFKRNREILERCLQGDRPARPLRPEQSCSIGQVACLVGKVGSTRDVDVSLQTVFSKLQGRQEFTSADNLGILNEVVEHRKPFAHIIKQRDYTSEDCAQFLNVARNSGWVFRFLSALQPK